MLVITAERLPHGTGTVLSEAPAPFGCVSWIVFDGLFAGHVKPDPDHQVTAVKVVVLKAHV